MTADGPKQGSEPSLRTGSKPTTVLVMTYEDVAFLNSPFTPRTFFLPGSTEPDVVEAIYLATSKNLHGEAVPSRRIQRLDYLHGGRRFRAEVGEQDQRGQGTVMAIFGPSSSRNLYYVTTLERGVVRGDPILVGSDEVLQVFEFLDD